MQDDECGDEGDSISSGQISLKIDRRLGIGSHHMHMGQRTIFRHERHCIDTAILNTCLPTYHLVTETNPPRPDSIPVGTWQLAATDSPSPFFRPRGDDDNQVHFTAPQNYSFRFLSLLRSMFVLSFVRSFARQLFSCPLRFLRRR